MDPETSISQARGAADHQDVRTLMETYAAGLPLDLAYQDFGAELADLPGRYRDPAGALFIARDARGRGVGCVGLRPLEPPVSCEMKRLFLLPEVRGAGLGARLVRRLLEHARGLGYLEMRLDSLESMTPALKLYQALGFRACPAYYGPTPAGTLFLSMRLAEEAAPRVC